MLTLTRKIRERVMIGDDIVVEIRGVEQGRVRLGIIAPRRLTVLREELLVGKKAVDAKKAAT